VPVNPTTVSQLLLGVILMRADQMMSRHVITVSVDASLVDAINTMLKHGVSGLPVVDEPESWSASCPKATSFVAPRSGLSESAAAC
jgi:hypothetical protein